ncbi:MAG TPA: hypothetical protein VKA30_05790 [Actinomycetota bacterium]|nr:hypothetical protein [Actinomycetota bacterium]
MSEHAASVDRAPSSIAGWFAATGGIAAWMTHIVVLSSLAKEACGSDTAEWAMHAVTLACALVVAAALVVSVRLARTESRPWRFIGRLGVILSLTNLLLIVFEGSYVVFLGPCH